MHCQVRSPDQILFEGESSLVAARGTQGEFAVMEDHAPLLAALRSGPLRIKTKESERVFACFGGTLRVDDGHDVTVLVDEAIPSEEIDEALGLLPSEGASERRDILLQIKESYG